MSATARAGSSTASVHAAAPSTPRLSWLQRRRDFLATAQVSVARHPDGLDSTVAAVAVDLDSRKVYAGRVYLGRDDGRFVSVFAEYPCAGLDAGDAEQAVRTRLLAAGVQVDGIWVRQTFD